MENAPVTPAVVADVVPVPATDPKAAVVNAANPVKVEPKDEVTPDQTPVAKRKIKWGDQEKEVTFEEAAKLAEKALGIENKMREASTKAQQAEALLHMLGNDPKAFRKQCKLAGIDADKLATELLWTKLEEDKLSPEERELREYKEREAQAQEEAKAKAEAEKLAEIDKKTQEWAQNFEKDLQAAMSAKKLPMSRLTLALAAQYIDAGLAQKKELTVNQVLPYVLRDLQNIHTSTMGTLEGEELLNYIGEELSNKVAAARVARYKKAPVTVAAPAPRTMDKRTEDISKLKGKAYWAALRKQKSEAGIDAFPGQ